MRILEPAGQRDGTRAESDKAPKPGAREALLADLRELL
jgi:hypothetical protein